MTEFRWDACAIITSLDGFGTARRRWPLAVVHHINPGNTFGKAFSAYRLQISRMVDGVKPERTDCMNVSVDERLNICAPHSFVIIRGMQRTDLTRLQHILICVTHTRDVTHDDIIA